MNNYQTPGVYVKETSLLPPSIVQISTAVPVFIGYTAGGAVNTPTRITSFKEFKDAFSGASGGAYHYEYAYTNTGATPTFAKIGGADLGVYFFYEAMQLYFENGGGACYVISTGLHGTTVEKADFDTSLALIDKLDEPTLIAFPEAVGMGTSKYGVLVQAALSLAKTTGDKFVLIDSPNKQDLLDSVKVTDFRTSLGNNYLNYGAAYYPKVRTTLSHQFKDTSTYNTATLSSLVGNANAIPANRAFNTEGQAIVSPSSLMAGVYASVDRARGVWKAPANVSLQGVEAPMVAISDEKQKGLNVDAGSGKSINAIRQFAGKGTIVWGARTLDGNSNEWRYIPVRRLFLTVEESVKKATSQFVFENNDAKTWVKVASMIRSYLNGLWEDGALMGATTDEAYFVNIGLGTTMTQEDILNGRMNVSIGIAAVRPAEFIVLEFSHFLNQ